MHIMTILSLMSPPFIGAYSWIILLGRNGLAAKLFTMLGLTAPTIYGRGGIIFVFTLHLFPYIYLYTSGAMNSIDSSLEEAAENLGMSKLRRIWTVTLPVILPSILAGCLMVFMTCLADFGTPMLLGEGYVVLPVLVYNEYMSESATDPFMASALSVVIVICSLLVLVFQKYVIDKRNYQMSSPAAGGSQLHGGKRLLASSYHSHLPGLASADSRHLPVLGAASQENESTYQLPDHTQAPVHQLITPTYSLQLP